MSIERSIVHMDLDTFFVSCERLIDRRLEGKPILIGGVSNRGVVASCSYEARRFGVHAAMPMKLARQLCPEAIVLRGNTSVYSQHSEDVTAIVNEMVPLYEKSSIDEFYIDLTGADRFLGAFKLAQEVRKRIMKETGLPISFGMSQNKTVSKIATGEAKPNNKIRILQGNEKMFLSPLSVKKIPMVGHATYKILCDLGVKKIATVQEMPVKMMERVLGKNGVSIWKKANGIDHTPVVAYQERKSISTERTFDKDTTDVALLKVMMTAMAEKLAFQLRRENKLTACVTVKLRYSDFKTYTMQSRIPYTAADHVLIPAVLDLYRKLYQRRLLIRLIGVRYSHLVQGGHQIQLFEDASEIIDLYAAMDHLRGKYGDRIIARASGMSS